MNHFNSFARLLLILWPLEVTLWACFYRSKQNGLNPWTGGPISWPKAFWLSYTIQTWFFLPFLYLFHSDVPTFLKNIILFHLISWWTRGILELVMIYKWFNWSPRYGISHDVFHILGCIGFLGFYWQDVTHLIFGSMGWLVGVYAFMLLVSTSAEISFAALFLRMRSIQEARENIYFASDDPKWIFINRLTLFVVVIVFCHLIYQSLYLLKYL